MLFELSALTVKMRPANVVPPSQDATLFRFLEMTSTRMVLARLRGLIIHIRKTPPNCLRCEGVKLRVLDCYPGLRNYECPICFRRYSKRDGGALVDRWLMPITLPLYAFVFRPL